MQRLLAKRGVGAGIRTASSTAKKLAKFCHVQKDSTPPMCGTLRCAADLTRDENCNERQKDASGLKVVH